MAAWKKSSPELVRVFHEALPDDPRVEQRQMFGYPAVFVGGNMIACLHEERLVVRLGEVERAKLRASPGALVFEPMKGRPMAEYTVVPVAMHGKPAELRAWIVKAISYGVGLPAKAKKAKKSATKTRRA